jgi:hypothetical protein
MRIFLITAILTVLPHAQAALQIERSCQGMMEDGSKVSARFFSNFDGCRSDVMGAVVLSVTPDGGPDVMLLGKRSFVNDRDVYSFYEGFQADFDTSPRSVEGVMQVDLETIALKCDEVWQYNYEECEAK